jgi:hypothetical protein
MNKQKGRPSPVVGSFNRMQFSIFFSWSQEGSMTVYGGIAMARNSSILLASLGILTATGISACATVGDDFPSDVNWILKDKTTRVELEQRLGAPFQVGYDSGQLTWTWGFYRYSLFRPTRTKDLVVRFNSTGTVSSYSFSSSFDEDIKNLKNK